MNKPVLLLACSLIWGLLSLSLGAQNASDIVVPVSVTTTTSPPSITLNFPATTNAVSTLIGKKLINQTTWSYVVRPANTTTFTDNNVIAGLGFEYIVIKQTSTAPTTRYGLVYAGIEVPATVYRGKMILVVDNTLSSPLATELDRFVQDLRGDGWQVLRHDINTATSTIQSVKTLIKNDYNADPNNTIAALLLGNIPVPYSGEINPDGHPDHVGAWPTDYYYSDLDEAGWTDTMVNNATAARAANRNIPGDGKFDQSQTPTPPELVVSRVDFSNENGWSVSQTELYRSYLNKNHAFRTGAYRPDNKTLIDDNFGFFGGEAFAQNGWANGYALTGTNSIVQGDFFNDTDNQSFLFAHGCGGGNYIGAAGVGTSDNFKTDSVNIVFSGLFGSYFGDWDYEDNPFMPSALASKGGILTCTWAGRPNWFFHHMGLGEPILTSTFLTWINGFLSNPMYPPNYGVDLVHVGLLGDPTLRAHAVKPPANVAATANCSNVSLSWTASADPALGYVVYRSPALDSIFEVLAVVDNTGFIDSLPLAGQNYYQVKAILLQTTPTGSYYNQSLGIPASANFNPTPPPVTAAATNITCKGAANGAVNLTVGSGTFNYLWSNGANTKNLSGLNAGTYTVTVTDAQLCSATASATITEPAALNPTSTATNISCFGLANGSISLTVTGGVMPYQYFWPTGDTAQNLANLSAGTYTPTITDANGCTATTSATVTAPTDISLTVAPADASCNGASNGGINLTISGGTPAYTYHWSNNSTGAFLANVPAGTYTVTATDKNGCSKTASGMVAQPPAIQITTTVSNAGCAGATNGGITLNVSNGVPGYSYLWSNGTTDKDLTNVAAGTYTVTVTDASGCTQTNFGIVQQITTLLLQTTVSNATCFELADGRAMAIASGGSPGYTYQWSNNANTATINNLAAGTYTATVTDDAGCSQVATATVGQPAQILLSAATTNVSCKGGSNGSIDLIINGGTPEYTYLWSNGQTTPDITGLVAGTFTVVATNKNGCTQTLSTSITEPLQALAAFASFVQTGCTGAVPLTGDVISTVNGGTSPYTYLWSNGTTTPNLTGVPSATYTVTVTDKNGCTKINSGLSFQFLPDWALNPTVTNVTCFGGNNGKIALSASGAAGSPYTFKWSNNSTTKDLSNLTAGTYTVTVTDKTGCTTTTATAVNQPTEIAVSITNVQNESCLGTANGKATLVASGGTPPYSYNWSNGETTATATQLTSGTATCTVTDANACIKIANTLISAPPLSGVAIVGNDSACLSLPALFNLPGNFSGYQWSASGNGTVTQGQGTNAATVIWSTTGTKTLAVHFNNTNNCPDSAVLQLTVSICVGTHETSLPGVQVMPNPFGAWLTIQFDRPVQAGAQLRLTDIQGRLIAEKSQLTEQVRLETADLPAGTYLLQIVENGRTGVWKMVKL